MKRFHGETNGADFRPGRVGDRRYWHVPGPEGF